MKNRLLIDNNTSYIIKEIFGLYKEGYGYSYIAKLLNIKGYPPPAENLKIKSAKGLWNPIAIKRILCNRVYVGETIQGISEKISFKSKKTRRLPPEKWVITPNTHESIIGSDEFEEIQKIRIGKKTYSCNHKGKIHLFKSIMSCGKCGSKMFARIRSNRPVGYVCGNYFKQGIKACTSHYVKENEIEYILIKEIEELFSDNLIHDKVMQQLEKSLIRQAEVCDRLMKLEKQILSKQRQQDILYMDKLDGKISEHLFIRMNVNIENRISQMRHEIEKEKERTTGPLDVNGLIQDTLCKLKTKGLTNEVIKIFVDRILIFDEGDGIDMQEISSLTIEEKLNAKEKGAVFIEFKFNS